MTASTAVVGCGICARNAEDSPPPANILWQDELWLVRHHRPPYGVAGWLTLYSKRHVAGPAHFNDAEAASFGPTLRHLERTLEDVTGALRIYTAALSESAPHFHGHMVPRYTEMPLGATSWDVFQLLRRVRAGEYTVDECEVARICTDMTRRLSA